MPEGLGMLDHDIREWAQVVVGALAIGLRAGEGGQAQQDIDSHTIARWSSIVHNVFGAADQGFVIAAGIKKATILLIGKESNGLIHNLVSLDEPARINTCLV